MSLSILTKWTFTLITIFYSCPIIAQISEDVHFLSHPRTATKLAIIPGGGQLYNHDYWKLPIVYMSIGGAIYSYQLNKLKYNDFLSAYFSFYDLDKNSPTYNQLVPNITYRTVKKRNLLNTKIVFQERTKDSIEREKDYWRRNKNISIIITGLIYSLSIIEANVASHLKTFDISGDLSLNFRPKMSQPMIGYPTPGISISIIIK